MDEIVREIGTKNNCTFCGVFRRQVLTNAFKSRPACSVSQSCHSSFQSARSCCGERGWWEEVCSFVHTSLVLLLRIVHNEVSTCRQSHLRLQALDRGGALKAAQKIATGHNADDIAETVLLNIIRGDLPRRVYSGAAAAPLHKHAAAV